MNCRKVSHLLSAYMDGELPGVELRQIREHIYRCAECCDEYDQLLQMKRMLGSLRVKEPNQDCQARILHHIAWEEQQRENRRPTLWIRRLRESGRAAFASPQGRVYSGGLLAAALLLAVRAVAVPTAADKSTGIAWTPAPPSVSEYVQGLEPSEPGRFTPQPEVGAYHGESGDGSRLQPAFSTSFPDGDRNGTTVEYRPVLLRARY